MIVATKNVQRMCKVLNAFREDDKFCLKQCDMIIVVDMKTSVIEDLEKRTIKIKKWDKLQLQYFSLCFI